MKNKTLQKVNHEYAEITAALTFAIVALKANNNISNQIKRIEELKNNCEDFQSQSIIHSSLESLKNQDPQSAISTLETHKLILLSIRTALNSNYQSKTGEFISDK